jgi:tetratricopeptide (TPR) repeat protein
MLQDVAEVPPQIKVRTSMFSDQEFRFCLVIVLATILLLPAGNGRAIAGGDEEQVCDLGADYSLGIEDYADAIRLYHQIVRRTPNNALAHYHLGFAEGMTGNRTAEVEEYQSAEALGLRNWDLYLNLGLAQRESGDLISATDSLRKAVLFGEEHSESHFNLALVEEQRGMIAEAEHETLASLRLSPGQPDARDLLGVIYAQEGETVRASQVWRELARDVPDYQPALTNLALLGSPSEVALGEAAAVAFPSPTAAVKAMEGERRPQSSAGETESSTGSPNKVDGE